jgi:hypothetical protein
VSLRSSGLALAALALALPAQEHDWDADVVKACTHARYAVRRAAANKIAGAGDAAVPALRKFTEEHGRNGISLLVVDALATRQSEHEEELTALLEEWARDRDFYWRSQALAALANRSLPALRELFRAALGDPAFLHRVHGAAGLCRLGHAEDLPAVRALLADPDPRVRLRVGIELLDRGDDTGLAAVIAAVPRVDEFLGDPWGVRDAQLALRSLVQRAGTDFGIAAAADAGARGEGLARLAAWAREQGIETAAPPASDTAFAGGVEIRSCRNGDLFVRFTEEGQIVEGLDPRPTVRLTARAWNDLRAGAVEFLGTGVHGTVVCDFVRVQLDAPAAHWKAAPGSLPQDLAVWLGSLSSACEDADKELGDALRTRLRQFIADTIK